MLPILKRYLNFDIFFFWSENLRQYDRILKSDLDVMVLTKLVKKPCANHKAWML